MNTKEEVLQKCVVEGNIVRLPNEDLDRKLYLEVAKSLNLIGGVWKSGKIKGFVFNEDPTDLLDEISQGNKKNLKKEFQFFETPAPLADRLVELAEIKETDSILEPSAGQGAIMKAIDRVIPSIKIDYFELMSVNRKILEKLNLSIFDIGEDFLEFSKKDVYDKIIANPPFSKNQDITHVKHMYECLKTGGRLVSITSAHWKLSTNKKESDFRNWLLEVNATEYDIEKGSFKESGTLVGGYILVIDKK